MSNVVQLAKFTRSGWLAVRTAWTNEFGDVNGPDGMALLDRDTMGSCHAYNDEWDRAHPPEEAAFIAVPRSKHELAAAVMELGLPQQDAVTVLSRLVTSFDDDASVMTVGRDAETGAARAILHFSRSVKATLNQPVTYTIQIEDAVSVGDHVPATAARSAVSAQFYEDLVAVAKECVKRGIRPDIDVNCLAVPGRTEAEVEFTRAMVRDQLECFREYAPGDWPFPEGTTLGLHGGDAERVAAPQASLRPSP